jgi:hypothetical protein
LALDEAGDVGLELGDAAVGELAAALDRLDQAVNIVVVSDHGMATVPPDRRVTLDEIAPASMNRVIYYGIVTGLEPTVCREAALSARLRGRHVRMEGWRREEMPTRFHFSRNARTSAGSCSERLLYPMVSGLRARMAMTMRHPVCRRCLSSPDRISGLATLSILSTTPKWRLS